MEKLWKNISKPMELKKSVGNAINSAGNAKESVGNAENSTGNAEKVKKLLKHSNK